MKKCPKCGTVLDESKKKCYMCGEEFDDDINFSKNDAFGVDIDFSGEENVCPVLKKSDVIPEKDEDEDEDQFKGLFNKDSELNSLNSQVYDDRSGLKKGIDNILGGKKNFKSRNDIHKKNNKKSVTDLNIPKDMKKAMNKDLDEESGLFGLFSKKKKKNVDEIPKDVKTISSTKLKAEEPEKVTEPVAEVPKEEVVKKEKKLSSKFGFVSTDDFDSSDSKNNDDLKHDVDKKSSVKKIESKIETSRKNEDKRENKGEIKVDEHESKEKSSKFFGNDDNASKSSIKENFDVFGDVGKKKIERKPRRDKDIKGYKENRLNNEEKKRAIVNFIGIIVLIASIVYVLNIVLGKEKDTSLNGLVYTIDESFKLTSSDSYSRYYVKNSDCSIKINYGPTNDGAGYVDNYLANIKSTYEKEGATQTYDEMKINDNLWTTMGIVFFPKEQSTIGGFTPLARYKYSVLLQKGNFYNIIFVNSKEDKTCSDMYDSFMKTLSFNESGK